MVSMPETDGRRYLLGTLSDDEMAAMEAAYFEDDGLRERLEHEEWSLIDAYVGGSLAAHERVAFERAYRATPARWARVEAARALLHRANLVTQTAPHAPAAVEAVSGAWRWRPALLTGLAAAAGVVLAVWQPWRAASSPVAPPQRTEVTLPAGAPDGSAPPPAGAAPGRAAPEAPALPTVMVALATGLTRDTGEASRVELPADGAVLRVVLMGGTAAWLGRTVIVRNVDTGAEWRGVAAPPESGDPSGAAAVVVIPPGSLGRGDYVVAVEGAPAARFVLRVR